jgi:hypothetical protein
MSADGVIVIAANDYTFSGDLLAEILPVIEPASALALIGRSPIQIFYPHDALRSSCRKVG